MTIQRVQASAEENFNNMQLVPVRTNQMNDKIVFRCMQKELYSHADLEKAIDK